jgi:hypothetical protein
LLAHDESGWGFGMPGISPVTTLSGDVVKGATIGLAGGTF